VVARPRTLYELNEVFKFQQGSDWFSKCGTENRMHVPAHYGAYWYTDSREEGLKRFEQVSEEMAKIHEDIGVILKRGCTEMEIKYGSSRKWEATEQAKRWDKNFLEAVEDEKTAIPQPEYVKRHVFRKWVEYAWSIGDLTCMAFNDNEPLYTPSEVYASNKKDKKADIINSHKKGVIIK
jgi:hypothetical protein